MQRVNFPITLVLGLRRTGKSSIVKVIMNENRENALWLYLDLRKFETREYLTYKDIVIELEKAFNSLPKWVKDFIKGLRGISVSGVEVRFNWSGEEKIELSQLFDRLSELGERNGKKVIIVFDESQELRKLKGYNILNPIAYSFDNLKFLRFIFTGSQIGMVYRFLKLKDPESPLFGRAMTEVVINPFDREKSIEFLRRGFEENNISVKDEILEEVYENVGGIPGWITYYGFNFITERDHKKALKKTIEMGVSSIKEEFDNFLIGREGGKERYYEIMKVCKKGCRWRDVKTAIEVAEGRKVDDKRVTELIENLVDASFLKKTDDIYEPTDPLIAQVF